MSAEFLGVGCAFPVTARDGKVVYSYQEDSVRDAIWLILATARGERPMRPDFGCGIHDLVFGVRGAGTSSRVASEVREALLDWEPRIDQVQVEVSQPRDPPEQLHIEIAYRVRATNNRYNLVYPFDLE